ncbi:MFS transporter [Peribacillus cavernae]|uniref:MFS transporter n=1 Tax=Peribacillus cavernae TaxID=1674310 RepID=A0A433H7F2_9BACI|nr:MFS transporter [Peribacillus cavernae]MDQ0218638.1 MFS family permease [Peribacillus cavernae]RUQ24232.1 MFS transporter [Peribacillus cavernae]
MGEKTAPWYKEISRYQWKTLSVAVTGYALDAMDFLLYSTVIMLIISEFGITPGFAGLISSASLMAAVLGGYLFGVLSDFIGRSKALYITVIIYSIGTFMSGFSQDATQLLMWRILLGLGMGGEWGAGMALVNETWPSKHRMKAIGFVQAGWPIGYLVAVIISSIVVPHLGWRGLFMLGVVPAIIVGIMRLKMPEPPSWIETKKSEKINPVELFHRKYIKRTFILTLFTTGGLFGYYAGGTWLPTMIKGPAEEGGFASPELVLPLMLVMNMLGIISFPLYGYLVDRFGNQKSVISLCGITCAIGMGIMAFAGSNIGMLTIGLIMIGLFEAFFVSYGVTISESYPTRIRGTALGFVFNTGRLIGGQAPVMVGMLAITMGLSKAMIIGSAGFILVALVSLILPQRNLEQVESVSNDIQSHPKEAQI